MDLETPEGKLSISDDELSFVPADLSPELHVSLNPMPEYKYERGLYGFGTLVIGDHTLVLRNEQASTVVEELRRPRASAGKTSTKTSKTDGDTATAK